jgi:hypothetical protein
MIRNVLRLPVLLIAGLASVATGCDAPDRVVSPVSITEARIQAGNRNVVIVRQSQPPNAQAPGVVATLAAALEQVAPGGIIKMVDGRHFVSNVDVTVPVTIEPLGSAHPVLDAQGAYGSLKIRLSNAGTVTLSGLRFENANWHNVQVDGSAGSVLIQNSEFFPNTSADPTQGILSGVFFTGSSASGTVRGSRFLGGDSGIGSFDFTGDLIIDANQFTGQVVGAIHTGGGSIDGRAFATSNTVNGCGTACIRLMGSGSKEVRMNVVRDDGDHPTETGIFLTGTTVVIEDNEITGTILGPGDGPEAYSVSFAGLNLYQVGSAVARRNQIRNVYSGIWLDASTLVASDMTIDHVVGAFGGWGPAQGNSLTLSTSDITNYVVPGGFLYGMYSFIFADARCNWWGSVDGPQNVGALTLAQVSPWATSSIAGTGRQC